MKNDTMRPVDRGEGLYRFSADRFGREPWALKDDFDYPRLVILLHGFTKHGGYLRELAEFLEGSSYRTFIFNYSSYRGIEFAAETLADYVSTYDRQSRGLLSANRFFLACHSMGGLVARSASLREEFRPLVRGIVMLGTPNDGCFPNSKLLDFLIRYGEHLAGPIPGARTRACRAARQMIKKDRGAADRPYIDELNDLWRRTSNCPPCLSVSGGLPYLQISDVNAVLNSFLNKRAQAMIGKQDNDGLVAEASVDLRRFSGMGDGDYLHLNSYPDYSQRNHTALKETQSIALKVVDWLDER